MLEEGETSSFFLADTTPLNEPTQNVDVKLKDLVFVLRKVDWYLLGIQLDVPRHILRKIERRNLHDEERMLTDMLSYWKDNDKDPSWEKIVQALERNGGHRNIITEIRSKYMTHDLSSSAELRVSSGEGGLSHDSDDEVTRPISTEINLLNVPSQHLDSPFTELSQSIKDSQNVSFSQRKTVGTKTSDRFCESAHVLTVKEDRLLAWFSGYLKERYKQIHIDASTKKFFPSPTKKIFKLAVIKKERIQHGKMDNDYVHKTVKGQVDNILLDNPPIELSNIIMNIHEGERKVILVDGAPGSGKSTMTVHMCQRWGEGELFQEFTIVILVQLRDSAVQRATSIAELLPCPDIKTAQQVATAIKASNGRGMLWVMDGWDELPLHLRKKSFFRDMISPPQIFPIALSSVIVTSRPISSIDLTNLVSSRLEVLGFTSEEQRQYFNECLKGDTKAVDDLMERLSENPIIQGSCYLPLNASIVAHLYLGDGSLPTTVYGLFSSFTQHIVSRNICKRLGETQEQARVLSLDKLPRKLQIAFNEMCKIAFVGTSEKKITFSHSDLEAFKELTIICEMGLLQATHSIISDGNMTYYHFIHVSIQEYLSAVYITELPASKQILTFNSLFGDSRFSTVFQFYSAITKLRISRKFLSKLPQRVIPQNITVHMRDLIERMVQQRNKRLLVDLFHCLMEAQDPSLCQFVIQKLKNETELDISETSLTPINCLAIGYFIHHMTVTLSTTTDKKIRVKLYCCSLGDAHIQSLMRGISRHMNPHNTVNTHILMDLAYNDIHDNGASHIIDMLNSISIVSELSLRGNPIGEKGLQTIFNVLKLNKTLKHLTINGCYMTDTGLASLADALKSNNTLERLDIYCNNEEIIDKILTFFTKVFSSSSVLVTLVIPTDLVVGKVKKTISEAGEKGGLEDSKVLDSTLLRFHSKRHVRAK